MNSEPLPQFASPEGSRHPVHEASTWAVSSCWARIRSWYTVAGRRSRRCSLCARVSTRQRIRSTPWRSSPPVLPRHIFAPFLTALTVSRHVQTLWSRFAVLRATALKSHERCRCAHRRARPPPHAGPRARGGGEPHAAMMRRPLARRFFAAILARARGVPHPSARASVTACAPEPGTSSPRGDRPRKREITCPPYAATIYGAKRHVRYSGNRA